MPVVLYPALVEPLLPPPPYCFYRQLVTDFTQAATADLTDWVCSVRVTLASLKTVGNGGNVQHTTTSNGQTVPADLAFFSDSSLLVPLKFEVESYDPTTGTLQAWVRLPVLHSSGSSTPTVFYMAYGAASITTFQGDVAGTWNSHYLLVAHLPNGSSLSAADSTSHANTGSITSATAAAGNLDGAASFNGSANISFPAGSTYAPASNSFTFSFWFKTSTVSSGSPHAVAGIYDNTLPGSSWLFYLDASNQLTFFGEGASVSCVDTANLSDGNWHYIVGFWDNGVQRLVLYVDNVFIASHGSGSWQPVSTTPLTLGTATAFGNAVAVLDEVRYTDVDIVLGTDAQSFLTPDYNSQKPGSTFLTVGSEVSLCASTPTWGWGEQLPTAPAARPYPLTAYTLPLLPPAAAVVWGWSQAQAPVPARVVRLQPDALTEPLKPIVAAVIWGWSQSHALPPARYPRTIAETLVEPMRPIVPIWGWSQVDAPTPPRPQDPATHTSTQFPPEPRPTHIFRRSLQWRAGSRTEPEKL